MHNYYNETELSELGLKSVGSNVKISKLASIYNAEKISISDNSRIDDFCVLSGVVEIGRNVHITAQCIISGGIEGVYLDDFVTIAYNSHVFSQSDDYSGLTMVNSTVPACFKNEKKCKTVLKKHVIIGANSTIFPGVIVEEGCAIGAKSLVIKSTNPWGIYFGIPIKFIKPRAKDILQLTEKYISGEY